MSRRNEAPEYEVPRTGLGLKGPVERPAAGTLPLRGDLAHIALADRYLVPHYVVPQSHVVADGGADLRVAAQVEADVSARLEGGSTFEVLDLAGGWYWGCVGPDGPSGYLPEAALTRAAS